MCGRYFNSIVVEHEGARTSAFNTEQLGLGSKSILVMDDEAAMRTIISRLLTHIGIGYIEVVADGAAAVHSYNKAMSENRPFSAVILDMTVPGGMGGHEAALQIRAMDPSMKAILTSGYANTILEAELKEQGFCAAIDKPYTIEQMKKTLLQVLGIERNLLLAYVVSR
jgi:CheY-like chemotaxis protein